MAVDAVGKEAVFQRTFHVVKKLGRIVVGAIDESSTGYSVNMTKVFGSQIKVLPSCSSTPKKRMA